jgi:hypothetical protein
LCGDLPIHGDAEILPRIFVNDIQHAQQLALDNLAAVQS